MKTVTPEELNRLIAEKVMGWEEEMRPTFPTGHKMPWYNGKPLNKYTPTIDANQALKALNNWCGKNHTGANLAVSDNQGYCRLPTIRYHISDGIMAKSLPTAICLALAEAATGEPHELKE